MACLKVAGKQQLERIDDEGLNSAHPLATHDLGGPRSASRRMGRQLLGGTLARRERRHEADRGIRGRGTCAGTVGEGHLGGYGVRRLLELVGPRGRSRKTASARATSGKVDRARAL